MSQANLATRLQIEIAKLPATEKAGTYRRILEEALVLFAQRGFHGTSVRDIASAVGVQIAAIYVHFPSKGHVLAELCRLGHEEHLRSLRTALLDAGSNAADQLAAVVRAHVRVHADYAMLAVQGPQAREIVGAISDGPLPDRFTCRSKMLRGQKVLVCGTGYTGEDGVELLLDPADAPMVWDEVVRRGAVPAGLAARDTLRLEVNYHLYGNDLMEERGPIEAGLGWACKEDTGFIGSEAVRAVREAGPSEKLVAFTMESGIARQGNPVAGGGEVTSGTMSPSLGIGIGMAYVPVAHAEVGTELEIDVRGKLRGAVVAKKPLYKK